MKYKTIKEIDLTKEIIPATYDPTFKALLSSEENKDYLADIVSYITKIPREKIINNLIIKNSELMKKNYREKRKTTDLIVDVLDNRINLEMNASYYNGLRQKNNTYQNQLAAEQYQSGDSYLEEMKIIQINFDDFETIYDERIIIKFQLLDKERLLLETENFEKYHVNLDLLKKKYYNKKEELTKEEKEILLLCMTNRQEIDKLVKGDDTMEEAKKKLEELSEDEELIGLYDKEIVDRKIKNTMILGARLEGIEQGKKEGANQKSIDIAKKMLSKKSDINFISEITGLTIEQIKNIK